MVNKKADFINGLGFITIVIGCIGSLTLGSMFPVRSGVYYIHESYNWALAIAGIISSVISGIVLIGFAEIINLLQKNVDNTQKISTVHEKTEIVDSNELPML